MRTTTRINPTAYAMPFLVFVVASLAAAYVSLAPVATFAQPTATSVAASARPPRKLAPGVVTIVPAEPQPGETMTGPITLDEVVSLPGLDFSPNYSAKTDTVHERAKQVTLRRDIWTLQFEFKPLRMTYVDIPQPNGNFERKLVWYMCYKVTNKGGHFTPSPTKDSFGHTVYETKQSDKPVYFIPHFVLDGVVPTSNGQYIHKEYLDRVIPVAQRVIEQREDIRKPLFNSVDIMKAPIKVSTETEDNSVWGVVTWENIDPRTDYFMVYAQGLTNAFQMAKTPDGGRAYRHKTLQLNFYRPGDSVLEHEGEVRYGIPVLGTPKDQDLIMEQYGLDPTKQRRVDHRWIYR